MCNLFHSLPSTATHDPSPLSPDTMPSSWLILSFQLWFLRLSVLLPRFVGKISSFVDLSIFNYLPLVFARLDCRSTTRQSPRYGFTRLFCLVGEFLEVYTSARNRIMMVENLASIGIHISRICCLVEQSLCEGLIRHILRYHQRFVRGRIYQPTQKRTVPSIKGIPLLDKIFKHFPRHLTTLLLYRLVRAEGHNSLFNISPTT
mmetsp:Transcript_4301/g.7431  ORF Transcript_4301/g.7431 Transcript_4301/m.7431 type:complete len:203 (-) Transcript_4301:700-1308(-)